MTPSIRWMGGACRVSGHAPVLPDQPLLPTRRPRVRTTALGSVTASPKGGYEEECPQGVLQLGQLSSHGPARP